MCVQSSRGGGQRNVCRSSGFTGGLHHLLLHLSSFSGWIHSHTLQSSSACCWTSIQFQTSFTLSLTFLPVFSFSSSLLPQCVCTLSPSPSKQSKPTPLDSLQLPLAPGFVTHTVSLCRPLPAKTNIHHQGSSCILEGMGGGHLSC